MPIFTYECLTCGKREDKLVKREEAENMQQCSCQVPFSMRKVDSFSPSLLKFKGNWHKTTGSY